jgi:hypothetical protein
MLTCKGNAITFRLFAKNGVSELSVHVFLLCFALLHFLVLLLSSEFTLNTLLKLVTGVTEKV